MMNSGYGFEIIQFMFLDVLKFSPTGRARESQFKKRWVQVLDSHLYCCGTELEVVKLDFE